MFEVFGAFEETEAGSSAKCRRAMQFSKFSELSCGASMK